MGPRKYYQHVERDPENVRSIWKVLHTSTFVLLLLSSLLSAYMFGNILKMFNYRCILHMDPVFNLIEVRYWNNTDNEPLPWEPVMKNISDYKTEVENTTMLETRMQTKREDDASEENSKAELLKFRFSLFNGTSDKTVNLSDADAISDTLKRSYVYNNTIWYSNGTMYGKVNARIRGSDYGLTTSCDLVLFVPLMSLIAAAAFGALIILFGRGRISERSWFMVYPVLIASAIMTILWIIATISMTNGLEDFCSKFQDFTGYISCSQYMNYFLYHEQATMGSFRKEYTICYYSNIISILLWIFQLVITILRLTTMADFQFVAVTVDTTEVNANEEYDDKIHNVLINSGMKPAIDMFPSDDDVSVTEKKEAITTV